MIRKFQRTAKEKFQFTPGMIKVMLGKKLKVKYDKQLLHDIVTY